ncbi:tetraacyldisaccharide 4'-kinase [Christiangramia flava]|uniref:Tetraacyldisaccharide 4'-kinase n=1 Tax=Christiangramia flava JLT2011 TaxID=1229726 RepID=A0A1L7I1E0_9FLAO|nr:tetraacyldisaccharide 4'-kinase [Christiangramia flava]APU67401.1 Tetraacyldisaccharide 4'-kinase [Christiangramia flava JLT2011]OSS39986.1 Tetraacyldisaccharide 4'-kinase [Christiangramia flava JLT2011]
MKHLRKLLYPFSVVYHGVTAARNTLYDLDILSSEKYELPIICVGNLSVGGTGKSPMIEYLLNLLKTEKVAVLSRGYKRKSTGFQLVAVNDSVLKSGDEPLQFKNKFPRAIIAVDANRQHGIAELQKFSPAVILLDDAFQHRKVQAGFQILLTRYDELFTKDLMLPAGNLRESRGGMRRADIILVTKCPSELSQEKMREIEREIAPASYQKVFFTGIEYDSSVFNSKESMLLQDFMREKFTLVTGIAKATPLVQHLNRLSGNFEHLEFGDHHAFSEEELKKLRTHERILTTEKDFMRLRNYFPAEQLYYLPIQVKFLNGTQSEFDQSIQNFINKKETR